MSHKGEVGSSDLVDVGHLLREAEGAKRLFMCALRSLDLLRSVGRFSLVCAGLRPARSLLVLFMKPHSPRCLNSTRRRFVGSVDSECSTCHDSVETRDIPAGQFTKETFRQRASSACYLSGPGVTRRGDMTTEVGLRLDEDRRIRVLVSHRPVFNGVEPPSQLRLERIVIVRETCALQDQNPPSIDSCWSFDRPSWLGLWRGTAMVLDENVDAGGSLEWQEDTVAPNHLRKCRCSGANDDDDAQASLEFDGGVLLNAPNVVEAGEPAELSVRWAVGRKSKAVSPDRIVQANVRFEALSRVVDTVRGAAGGNNVRISPPKLLGFSVESLKPVESAGLG